jgi:photosystem II stability/assembly factor-like uncharacterized protein
MKRILLAGAVAIGAIAVLFTTQSDRAPFPGEEAFISEHGRKPAAIKEAFKWFDQNRSNAITGKFEISDHYKALEEIEKNFKNVARKSGGIVWQEMGPDNTGGRTRSLMVYKPNPNVMFAGGVSGGLFRTDNGGNDWSRLHLLDNNCTDRQVMSIGSIAQDANGIIYVGTGESIGTGYPGKGIYKSTDGGYTFCNMASTTVTSATPNNTWSYVNKIVVDPNNVDRIYAASRGGLQVSSDGGSSWSRASGTPNAHTYDLEISSDGMKVHAVIGQQYYRSEDSGNSWTKVNGTGDFPNGGYNRLIIAGAPSNDDYIYAIMSTNSGLFGVYQSRDAGLNWEVIGAGGTSTFNPPGAQGWYDLEIAVPPYDFNKCYVGGQINIWSWTISDGWRDITSGGSRYVHPDHHVITFHPTNPDLMYIGTDGGMFRSKDATLDYPTFQEINKNYVTTQFYHIDASEATGEVLGGTQDNGTHNIKFTGNTTQASRWVIGGDGFDCNISRHNPKAFFGGSQFGALRRSLNGGDGFGTMFDLNIDADGDGDPDEQAGFWTRHRLWEGIDDTLTQTLVNGVLAYQDSVVIDTVLMDTTTFSVPYIAYDTVVKQVEKPSRLFFSTGSGLWMADDAVSAPNPVWYKVASYSGTANGMAVSADGDHFYVARGGTLYRISGLRDAVYGYYFDCTLDTSLVIECLFRRGLAGISRTVVYSGQGINDIYVDPNNNDHVVIAHGSYGSATTIRESWNATSGSPTWSAISGSGSTRLPSIPVYSCLIDAKNSNKVYAGTEYGVFVKHGAGNIWTQEIEGMDQVQVLALRQYKHPEGLLAQDGSDSMVVYAGTYGRGMFCYGFVPKKPATGIVDPKQSGTVEALNIFPNPGQSRTSIDFTLANSGNVTLQVLNLAGQVVTQEMRGYLNAGQHRMELKVSSLPQGMYVVRMQTGEATAVGRLMIAR